MQTEIQDDARLLQAVYNNPKDYKTMFILADCLTDLSRTETAESWRWIAIRERSPALLDNRYATHYNWMWQEVDRGNWQRMGSNALPPDVFRFLKEGMYFTFQRRYQTKEEAFADLISALVLIQQNSTRKD